MTLFVLLLVLFAERIGKTSARWQLDYQLIPLFKTQQQFSLLRTTAFFLLIFLMTEVIEQYLSGLFYGIFSLLFWLALVWLCIGAGEVRRHYQHYLLAVKQADVTGQAKLSQQLGYYHPGLAKAENNVYLRELQNTLLWINYRFYSGPLFWLVVGGANGPALLVGYSFLRAWQNYLAKHVSAGQRQESCVDTLLFWMDFVPVRLVGLAYAFFGHGEKALPAWWRYLSRFQLAPNRIISHLAQYSLEPDACDDPIAMACQAVALAKKVTTSMVVVVAILTLVGIL